VNLTDFKKLQKRFNEYKNIPKSLDMRGKIRFFFLFLTFLIIFSLFGCNNTAELKHPESYNLFKSKNYISTIKDFFFNIFIYLKKVFIYTKALLKDSVKHFSYNIEKMINSKSFFKSLINTCKKTLKETNFFEKSKFYNKQIINKQIFSSNMIVEEKNNKEKVSELKNFCLLYEQKINDYLLNQYERGLSKEDVISIDILYTGSLPDMSKYERYRFRFIKVANEKYEEIVNSNLHKIEDLKKNMGNVSKTGIDSNNIDKQKIDNKNSGSNNKIEKEDKIKGTKATNSKIEKAKLRVVKYKLTLIDNKPVFIAEFAGVRENFYGYLNIDEKVMPAIPSGYIFCNTKNIPEISFSIFYYYPLDISNNEVAIGFYEKFKLSRIVLYCFIVYIFILIILLLLYLLILSYTFNKIKEKNPCLIKKEKKINQKFEAGKEENIKTIIYSARNIYNNNKEEPTKQKKLNMAHFASQKEGYHNVNNNIRNNIYYNIEKNEKSSKIDETDDLKFSPESEQENFFEDLFKKDEIFMEKESLTENNRMKDLSRDSHGEKSYNEATTLDKIGKKIELDEIPHFEDKKD